MERRTFKRTIIKTPRGNYVMTLPKKWVLEVLSRHGDVRELEVVTDGEQLVVKPVIQG